MHANRADGFNHRLESLRGVAAMMVAFGHAFLVLETKPFKGLLYLFNGHAAVTLFFVLSGYVLGLALRRADGPVGREFVRFGIRRVLRIYPAFLIGTFFVLILLRPFPGGPGYALASPWFNQFYHVPVTTTELQDNLLFLSSSLNCVTWTLRVEIVGSLLLAALHWAGRGLPGWGKAGLLGGLIGWALAFPTGWLSPYLFMFYLGYLLPEAAPRVMARWRGNRWLTLSVLGLALLVFLRARETRVMLWAEPLAGAIVLACLVHGVQFKFYEMLDWPWTRFYGRISYSFYLLHFPVLYLTAVYFMEILPADWLRSWPHAAGFLLAMVSSLAATLPAWALFRCVEKPGIALAKRLTGSRDRSQPAERQPVILTASGS